MPNYQLRSPWLEQLNRTRPLAHVHQDEQTDIAIIGGGIAGVATAYFLLKYTNKKIFLLEADRIAHGATGHNGGFLASYFERPLTDIANEFGDKMAVDGQRSIESSWDYLAEMHKDLQIETPYLTFIGFAGFLDTKEILTHLGNHALCKAQGLSREKILIAAEHAKHEHIPSKFRGLYELVPHARILELLETKNRNYIGLLSERKGCMNSARFTEEVMSALEKRYPKRLIIAEHTPVSKVTLHRQHAELHVPRHIITAKNVILCTNGFERITIENTKGADINTKFHHLIRGSVGYMAAYLESPYHAPTAISYLPPHLHEGGSVYDSEPYFYLTRRPHAANFSNSLLCIGGPEALMDDTRNYSREHPYPAEAKKMIKDFLAKSYRQSGKKIREAYFWHGLMGYTPNGLRCIGPEPCNSVLLYNLGCNGVGLLPSIYGGYRISQIIKKGKLEPSIFDPADQRCLLPEPRVIKKQQSAQRWLHPKYVWGFCAVWILIITTVLTYYWSTL